MSSCTEERYPELVTGPGTLRLVAHAAQKKQEKDEEDEMLTLQKARELDEFDQQNHGAMQTKRRMVSTVQTV
ncbi:unnamed protein product [Arabis nemorensis]|uniref:Uncharacterized protein n=1 Tax=Arabis nemorensis TaxID=586526 RepID=A0A565ANE9_9BRAS|nr:unnamed protein product [Arabis nemorensis]